MSETLRLVCPVGRKYGELWAGIAFLVLGAAVVALSPTHWANIVLGALLLVGGIALLLDGYRIKQPVLEMSDGELRYIRGRYIVRIPRAEIGSYYLLPGRGRSLGLCDTAGRPKRFPSIEGRWASRPYLPLTSLTSTDKLEFFMGVAGIPPRNRSLAP